MYIRMVVHNRMTLHKIFESLFFTYSVRSHTLILMKMMRLRDIFVSEIRPHILHKNYYKKVVLHTLVAEVICTRHN